ncbi:Sulfotransferase family protein [Loktanella atrilutea]|uniref:Sulfotransferase family protein n=1 Tax=Loktanella atrilutea TaxID=366533 RepID=A0A1M5EMC1_LOKAT|nr:sulfotransferase family 2 domain-containing protein [Loktanella atrilutea]SHF80260.1 Sulfotransferase family protein [Loktanella atrilutea]
MHRGQIAISGTVIIVQRTIVPETLPSVAAGDPSDAASNARVLHFLHIGKAAGTQVRHLARQVNAAQDRWRIVKHDHNTNLRDLTREDAYFFSIRDPLTRFVSGFYSRKRKGQPRLNVPWTMDERQAFKRFPHANDLAEALFAPGARGLDAIAAIKSIRHTSKNQVDWFESRGALLTVQPPVWILRQERFEADWASLVRRLGLTGKFTPTRDDAKSHRNDYSDVPPLSAKARANLTTWYVQDIHFYEMCATWLDSPPPRPSRRPRASRLNS